MVLRRCAWCAPTRFSFPREIDEHDFRVFLHALEDDLAAVWSNVEIPKVEVGRQVGQLALGSCLQIDQPEVLVLALSPHQHECVSPLKEAQTSGSAGSVRFGKG